MMIRDGAPLRLWYLVTAFDEVAPIT